MLLLHAHLNSRMGNLISWRCIVKKFTRLYVKGAESVMQDKWVDTKIYIYLKVTDTEMQIKWVDARIYTRRTIIPDRLEDVTITMNRDLLKNMINWFGNELKVDKKKDMMAFGRSLMYQRTKKGKKGRIVKLSKRMKEWFDFYMTFSWSCTNSLCYFIKDWKERKEAWNNGKIGEFFLVHCFEDGGFGHC